MDQKSNDYIFITLHPGFWKDFDLPTLPNILKTFQISKTSNFDHDASYYANVVLLLPMSLLFSALFWLDKVKKIFKPK